MGHIHFSSSPHGVTPKFDGRLAGGFTLIELVVAMSLSVIVVAFMALFITAPVQGYRAQTRRAELVDSADNVLREVARDVRSALPNSVRVNINGVIRSLALIPTIDAVRYRDSDALTNPQDELDFSATDTQFSTLGKFSGITRPFSSRSHFLVIYNVGIPGADAYEVANVITPANMQIGISDGAIAGEDAVTLESPGFRFAYASPGQRVFLATGPITYLCNPTTGTLTKYTGHTLATAQSTNAATLTGAGGTAAIVARDISACEINYNTGAAQRAGLVTLDVTVSRNGERVRLLHQVHVENVP